MLVISSNIFLVLSLHAVFHPYVNRLHTFKHQKVCRCSANTRETWAAAGSVASSRNRLTRRSPDLPTQIKLSHGGDGQVQTDGVAVRVVFVGAVERFSGLKQKNIYILYPNIFCKEVAGKCK